MNGDTRPLVVGRAKIETRPLLLIKARSADGDTASVILQNDWHVRVLGRAGVVHNITELKVGSVIWDTQRQVRDMSAWRWTNTVWNNRSERPRPGWTTSKSTGVRRP